MPGLWLTRIALRFTRPHTFERLVSPAIADLQPEPGRFVTGMADYAGILALLFWALVPVSKRELRQLVEGNGSGVAWRRAAAWTLAALAINWIYFYRVIASQLAEWRVPEADTTFILDGSVFRA